MGMLACPLLFSPVSKDGEDSMDSEWREWQQRVDIELISGTSFLFYAIITKLADADVISKERFADELATAIDEAEAACGAKNPNLGFVMADTREDVARSKSSAVDADRDSRRARGPMSSFCNVNICLTPRGSSARLGCI
jgi:hypothetical protein